MTIVLIILLFSPFAWAKTGNKIVHDTEYYILEAQHAKQWKAMDRKVDNKLAQFRKKNGGKTQAGK